MNKAFFPSIVFACTVILFACNSGNNESAPASRLVGEWNNISIKVDIQTENDSDSNGVFEAKRGEWEQVLKIRPIRTFFNADSTWHSAHYTLKDSLFYDPSGRWWIEGDSLVMQQQLPAPETTKYLLTLNGDTASFRGILDWDTDKKRDDIYFGEQIRK